MYKRQALDYLKHEEVKRSAFEVMADWQQQELSIRMSALEAVSYTHLVKCHYKNVRKYLHFVLSDMILFPYLYKLVLFVTELLYGVNYWAY